MDRELKKVINEGIEVGTRIAVALEKLVNEPLIEVEPPPPQCPHCGTINPTIQVDQTAGVGVGKIAEYVLEARCSECNKPIFGVVRAWDVQGSRRDALVAGNRIMKGR